MYRITNCVAIAINFLLINFYWLETGGIGFVRDRLEYIQGIMNLHDDVLPSSIYNWRTVVSKEIKSANYRCDIGENGQKVTLFLVKNRSPRPSVSLSSN